MFGGGDRLPLDFLIVKHPGRKQGGGEYYLRLHDWQG